MGESLEFAIALMIRRFPPPAFFVRVNAVSNEFPIFHDLPNSINRIGIKRRIFT